MNNVEKQLVLASKDWWKSMTPTQQKQYLNQHKHSRLHKEFKTKDSKSISTKPAAPKSATAIDTSKIPEILERPTIKFSRKDHLNPNKLKTIAWHGCSLKQAKNILENGTRKGFSITGNKEEAAEYAYTYTITSKKNTDHAVLEVDTSYIKKDKIDPYYYDSPQYLFYTDKLPPQAFKIVAIVPYKKVIKKAKEKAKTLHDMMKDAVSNLAITHDDGEGIDFTTTDNTLQTVKNLCKNGWKIKEKYKSTFNGKYVPTYHLEKDGNHIRVTKDVNSDNKTKIYLVDENDN